jgi:microsomal dipeptidase-like Zn-dependent dipeptidase
MKSTALTLALVLTLPGAALAQDEGIEDVIQPEVEAKPKRSTWQLFWTIALGKVGTPRAGETYEASEQAQALHDTLFVADLHTDVLLWNRNLLKRHDRGDVDLPRLQEGNVALQVFSAVTRMPKGHNHESNPSQGKDELTQLVAIQRWPMRTWFSLHKRALHMSKKLHRFAKRSDGGVVVVRSRADLQALEAKRQQGERVVGGLLSVEGAHCLEGKLEHVDTLFEAGYRMFGLTHFFDNELGGSIHGEAKGGLTDFGRQAIERMEELGIVVDVAHASSATIVDVLEVATKPVLVSHTGVRGTCDNPRNLSDAQLRAIAATGGVIGIGYWPRAVCVSGDDVTPIARAIRHAVDVVGVEHVALGSDFDGAEGIPMDASGLALVTQALLAERFSEDEIRLIMGGNVRRLLGELLPAE